MIIDKLDSVRQETLGTSPEGTIHNLENKICSWHQKTDPRLFLSWRLSHTLYVSGGNSIDKDISLSY